MTERRHRGRQSEIDEPDDLERLDNEREPKAERKRHRDPEEVDERRWSERRRHPRQRDRRGGREDG